MRWHFPKKTTALAGLLGLLLVGGLAGILVIWRPPIENGTPTVYVICKDAPLTLQQELRSSTFTTSRGARPGQTLRLPPGATAFLIKSDGSTHIIQGAETIRFSAPENEVQNIFTTPLRALLKKLPLRVEPTLGPISVTSPIGLTRFLAPTLTWNAAANTDYDVAWVDPDDELMPPRTALRVRPPVTFSQLQTSTPQPIQRDRIYQVVVRQSDAPTTTGFAHVLVHRDASDQPFPATPAELLLEATAALAQKPNRTGDAWFALSQLPPDWRRTELAVRLRLRLAVDLGLSDELASARADATAHLP